MHSSPNRYVRNFHRWLVIKNFLRTPHHWTLSVACKISRYTNCLSKAFRKSIKWRHNTKIAPDVCFPVLHVYFLLTELGTDIDKKLYWEFVINLVEWILFRIYRILNVKDIAPGIRRRVVLYKLTGMSEEYTAAIIRAYYDRRNTFPRNVCNFLTTCRHIPEATI